MNGKAIMNVSARTRRAALAAAPLAALLALAGCSKEITKVDAGYTTPEGVVSDRARLMVYPDRAMTVTTWIDNLDRSLNESGVSGTWNPASAVDPEGDVQVGSATYQPAGAGTLHGILIDGTSASAYQILRREASGGLLPLGDQALQPLRKWLDSGNELYAFDDPSPSGFTPATYVGRGLVAGAVASRSPVSNTAPVAAAGIADITYIDEIPSVSRFDGRNPNDSLFVISWQPVTGAAGYWVQIYEYLPSTNTLQRRLLGAPAPLAVNGVRDLFLAWCPPGVTSLRLGQPGGHSVLTFRATAFRFGAEYNVRVSAVDDEGRLIAMTLGDTPADAFVGASATSGRIDVSPRGAAKVATLKPTP